MKLIALVAVLTACVGGVRVSDVAPFSERYPPYAVSFAPALYRSFSYLYRHLRVELPQCLHGQVVSDSVESWLQLDFASFPNAKPNELYQDSTGIFGCHVSRVGLAHAHLGNLQLPDRCMLSSKDRAVFLNPNYPLYVQVIICGDGLLGIHWPDRTYVVCKYDPLSENPFCEPVTQEDLFRRD